MAVPICSSSGPDRPRPSLLVLSPSGRAEGELRRFELDLDEVVLGRDRICDIVLDEERVSRRHARIRLGARAVLEDLGSRNGTRVNGSAVGTEPMELSDGDWIDIGSARIRFLDPTTRAAANGPSGAGALAEEALATVVDTVSSGHAEQTIAVEHTALLDSRETEDAILRIVVRPRGAAQLLVREGQTTREHALSGSPITIGREPGADVRLVDPLCSGRHARIERGEAGWTFSDLGSRNGTLVNGVATRSRVLEDGDVVRIGSVEIVFRGANRSRGARRASRRPVVIVPGLASCELHLRGERVWPNAVRLLSCPEARLREYWGDLEVGGLIREQTVVPGFVRIESFGSLVDYLTSMLDYVPGEDLLEFAYDWRRDVRDNARQLASAVARWRATRADPAERVTVVAHSMGGLVSRWWLGRLGGADAVERIVFLGTPHEGSVTSLRSLLAGVALLPFGVALRKIRLLAQGFPSVYQLLPAYPAATFDDGTPFDPFADDGWLEPACRRHLEAAVGFRRELSELPLAVPATSVFGYRQNTLRSLRLTRERSGTLAVRDEEHDSAGDGTVAEHSAVFPGSEIHPVVQQHGALHTDRDVLRRLRYELLER